MLRKRFRENRIYRWNELKWKQAYLAPRSFRNDGSYSSPGSDTGFLQKHISEDRHNFTIDSPERSGKVTDCGYDQFVCCYVAIPAGFDITVEADLTVRAFCRDSSPNGQEAFGLFFRDSVQPEPSTGLFYSNMIAAGAWKGVFNIFGRCGIDCHDTEKIDNIFPDVFAGTVPVGNTSVHVRLSRTGCVVHGAVSVSGSGEVLASFEGALPSGAFNRLEHTHVYVGFLAARGSEIVVRKDSFRLRLGCRHAASAAAPPRREDPLPAMPDNCEEDGDRKNMAAQPLHVIWASPAGTPSASGTKQVPWDLHTAMEHFDQADEIRLLPGVYHPAQSLVLERFSCGRSSRRKRLVGAAEAGNPVVLDFAGNDAGLFVEGDGWEIEHLDVAGGLGIQVRGSYNKVINCRAYRNHDTGIQIRNGDDFSLRAEWPSYNSVIGCTAFENCDPSGQHADGFACKVSAGEGNRFSDCIAYLNTDDGFDLFSKNRAIGTVTLERCKSYLNGYLPGRDGSLIPAAGNGNGFKLGGSGLAIHHVVKDCTAAANRGCGFTNNSNPAVELLRCSAFNNERKNVTYYAHSKAALQQHFHKECDFEDRVDFTIQALLKELKDE